VNVLLVSKDSDLGRAAGRALRGRGHRVKVRQDLAAARELLTERRPALVLLDVDIGRDTVTALLGQLRASMRHQDVPVVVTSGLLRAGTPFVERCLHELGATCFMERPVPDGDWPLVLERVYDGELFGEEIRSMSHTASPNGSGLSPRRSTARRLLGARRGRREVQPEPDEWSTASVSRVSGTSPSSAPAPSRSQRSAARRVDLEDPRSLILRLRRELTILGTVSDRAALAMPLDAPVRRAPRYASRMKRRYLRFADPAMQQPEVVAVAADILARIDQAVEQLSRDRPSDSGSATSMVSSVGPRPDYKELMALGRTALSTGRPAQAIACFRGARGERPGDAEPLAWLGWALATDKRRPKEGRMAEALEFLHLADQFDSTLAEGQFFLARLELESGSTEVARARLKRLLKHHPGHAQARKLLDRAQG
jgi:FixJ family two-component response regulator